MMAASPNPAATPAPAAPEPHPAAPQAAAVAALVDGSAPWPFRPSLPAGVTLPHLLLELRRLCWAAADILLAYGRGEQPPYGFPRALHVAATGEGPVTAADLAVNQWLLEGLKASFPAAGWSLLSEETAGEQLRSGEPLRAEWLWILDPLDGTRDFLQGTGEYAVHLALVHRGAPRLGVVLLPEKGELWIGVINPANATAATTDSASAAAAAGGLLPGLAWCENRAGAVAPVAFSGRQRPGDLVLVASRNHRDQRLEQLLAALAVADIRAVGSVGGKVAAILRGEADLYLSLSGRTAPKDWDMAAPQALLQAAGGAFSHADGRPLSYTSGDWRQAGCLIASHGFCHGEVCRIAAAALATIDPDFVL
jgi:3'(2'), 5'-bisphosphate nucleotidase